MDTFANECVEPHAFSIAPCEHGPKNRSIVSLLFMVTTMGTKTARGLSIHSACNVQAQVCVVLEQSYKSSSATNSAATKWT